MEEERRTFTPAPPRYLKGKNVTYFPDQSFVFRIKIEFSPSQTGPKNPSLHAHLNPG